MRRIALPLLLWVTPVVAHDFWIEPSTFRPAPGDAVAISLRVGERFRGNPVVRNNAFIERFVVRDAAGTRPVDGADGSDPAGAIRVARGGAMVVTYRSVPRPVELDAETFEAYLREEGLEAVIEARRRRGESDRPGREIYSRCAKTILGDGDSSAPAGLRLEIVPESPLREAKVRFRVDYESKPLAGARVVAIHREGPLLTVQGQSDHDGRVTLDLPRGGVWLVKTVHMIRAAKRSGADWESLWASLTFERN